MDAYYRLCEWLWVACAVVFAVCVFLLVTGICPCDLQAATSCLRAAK